ncbi:unnamed protein product [Caretta caretta]
MTFVKKPSSCLKMDDEHTCFHSNEESSIDIKENTLKDFEFNWAPHTECIKKKYKRPLGQNNHIRIN